MRTFRINQPAEYLGGFFVLLLVIGRVEHFEELGMEVGTIRTSARPTLERILSAISSGRATYSAELIGSAPASIVAGSGRRR